MPEKEGAEEKTTKSVVNKKQKQMMGEEGYDHLRDMGRIRKNKKKKDATTMPPSKEMEKTRKVNKGPSALERVKADIEKRYGKGAIMNVSKEELDLTKVAEAFGGFIVEKKQFKQGKLFKFKSGAQGEIASGSPEMGGESEKFVKGKKKKFNILTDPDPDADSLAAKSETDKGVKQQVDKEINKAKAEKNLKSKVKTGTTKAGEDASKVVKKTTTTTPKVTRSKTPIFDVDKKGQGRFDLGDTTTTGDPISTKKQRRLKGTTAIGTPKKSGGRQLQIKGLTKQGRRSDKLTAKGLERVRKKVADSAAKETAKKATQSVAVKQARKQIAKGAAKTVVKKAAAKGAAKFALKRIPGIGAAISGAEAIGRAASGDFVGAALAAGEGIASSIPGAGTAASAGLGAVSAARDARRAMKVGSKLTKSTKAAYKTARKVTKKYKTPKNVTKAFKGDPKKFGVDTTPRGQRIKDYLFKPLKGTGNKKADIFLGKTRAGRITRIGLTKDKIKDFVGGIKPKSPEGSHVGRRTAG